MGWFLLKWAAFGELLGWKSPTRSGNTVYKCTSQFCNRNIAKVVAKVKALGVELVLPDLRGCKRLYSETEVKCKSKYVSVILFMWMPFYTFVTINLQLQLCFDYVYVCKSKDSAFRIRTLRVNFHLQILMWQVLEFSYWSTFIHIDMDS